MLNLRSEIISIETLGQAWIEGGHKVIDYFIDNDR